MSAPVLLKIVLKKTPNYIWRRFVVSSDLPLDQLHGIVQSVMGWENRRLHSFIVRKQGYFPSDAIPDGGLSENEFTLDRLVHRTGARLLYVYGPWEHDLIVEKMRYSNPAWPFPVYCLEGVRSCPPESCSDMKEFVAHLKASGDHDSFDWATVNQTLGVNGPIPVLEKAAPEKPKVSKAVDPLHRLGRLLKQAAFYTE